MDLPAWQTQSVSTIKQKQRCNVGCSLSFVLRVASYLHM